MEGFVIGRSASAVLQKVGERGEHLGESCDSSLPLTKGTAAAILLQRFTPAPGNNVQDVKPELV